MANLNASGVLTNIANLNGSGVVANIATVAGAVSNVNTTAGAIANVNSVASNIASVNNFGEVYRIASSAPSSSLTAGDLYFNTSTNVLNVYGASGWQNAGSSVNGTSQRYHYDISGTPTAVTGNDAAGNTLAYDAGFIDVFLNGVRMSTADVTVTSGDTVTFASALANGDEVDIVAYGTFAVAAINADNLNSGTVPVARVAGSYTGVTGTGALNAGTITSGFGNINTGASTITTTGAVATGALTAGGIIKANVINENTSGSGVTVDSLAIKDGKITNLMNATLSAADLGAGVHIKTADSGASVSADADDLVIEEGTSGQGAGMTILNATNGYGFINFGDSGDNDIGKISYDHPNNALRFNTNGAERMRIDSAGLVRINDVDASNSLIANNFDLVIGNESSGASGLAIISPNNENGYIGFFDPDNSGSFRGTIHYFHTDDYMQIYTAGAVGLRQHSNQVLSASAGIALGVGTANTASNVLDDYEEGTWTPVIKSHANTISRASGSEFNTYTKIGRQVTVTFSLQAVTLSGTINNAGDFTRILGLPFTTSSTAGQRFPSTQLMYFSSGSKFEEENITCNVGTNSNYIEVHEHDGAGTGYSPARIANLTSNTYWFFTMTYFV